MGIVLAQSSAALYLIAATLGGLVIGSVVMYLVIRVVESRYESGIRHQAELIVDGAAREAKRLVREAEIAAREEALLRKADLEREVRDSQARKLEADRDTEHLRLDLERREAAVGAHEEAAGVRLAAVETRERVLAESEARQEADLARLAGLSRDEATELLLARLSSELEHEQSALISRSVERTRDEIARECRKIIATAIYRVAADHTQEVTVSSVDLPSDEMKGRIIGREGRNIRAFEQATGVDVIVDDTPGVVVISAFDAVRREVARRSLEKLIADGRIHPARIEETVEETRKEIDARIQEAGKQACLEMELPGLHPKLVTLVGRMHFRTSYGQNLLSHSIEVAHLCGAIAGELKLDVSLAKRCGLLHDVGKAVDQEMEGGHPEVGADVCRRYDEPPEVVNAVASHHDGVPQETLYAFLVMAADAISGSRPGARRETLDRYIHRMEKLEDVAKSFKGVDRVFAIQAGREVRVVVDANAISDKVAPKLARDIALAIEQKLTYPGEIKVTLIRETRVIEYAR